MRSLFLAAVIMVASPALAAGEAIKKRTTLGGAPGDGVAGFIECSLATTGLSVQYSFGVLGSSATYPVVFSLAQAQKFNESVTAALTSSVAVLGEVVPGSTVTQYTVHQGRNSKTLAIKANDFVAELNEAANSQALVDLIDAQCPDRVLTF